MDLINHDNFNFDNMCDYLISSKDDMHDSQGVFIPKNKSKNRFFQLFLEYLDNNNDIIKLSNEQLIKLKQLFNKIKEYDSYKYYELFIISSYDNYLNLNLSKDEKQSITYQWISYCLKMSEYHRVYGIIKHNIDWFDYDFSIKVLNLLLQYIKKNTGYIIGAFKNDSFDKDFKLLYLLFSTLSFKNKIGIKDYLQFKEGIIGYFNGVHEVFFSFFLNKQWHGIYNDSEYRNRRCTRDLSGPIKKETVKPFGSGISGSSSSSSSSNDNNDLQFENSSDEDDSISQDDILKIGEEFLDSNINILDKDEVKNKCYAFNSEGVVRFFINLSSPLEIKVNQNLYFEYVSLLIELSKDYKALPLERNDTYYKTYNYYLNSNINESILHLITITPYVQDKLYDRILSILFQEKDLFFNYNNYFDLERDFGLTIDTLLKHCEFNYQVFTEFVKFFIDRLKGKFNNNERQYFKNKVIHFVRLFKNIDLSDAIPIINIKCQKLNLKQIDLFAFVAFYIKLKLINLTLKDKLLLSSVFNIEEHFLKFIKTKDKMKLFIDYYKLVFSVLKKEMFIQHPTFCMNLYSNLDKHPIKKQFIISMLDHLIIIYDFNFITKFFYNNFKEMIDNSYYYKKKLKWCYQPDEFTTSVQLTDELYKYILLFLLGDPSTNQLRRLAISLVSKNFREIVINEMNDSLKYPVDIGTEIYNIKVDCLNSYSLLVPSKVKYLKYKVRNFFDPNLSILKIFKSIVKLEVDGLTELEEATLQILDSIKTLKVIQINVLPFNRIDQFFSGFNGFQGYIRDQYIDTQRDLDFYEIDCTTYPSSLNIKIDSFEEFKKSLYGKEFHLFIQDYKGEFDCKLNQIMKFHIHIIKYKKIETTCTDFLLYYYSSYHLNKIPQFSLLLNSRPDKRLVECFKNNKHNRKLENIIEMEFIINKICNIKTIHVMLSVLELAVNIEKISIKFKYDSKNDGLLDDGECCCGCICGEFTDIDKIIESNLESLFKTISDKFNSVNYIEVSDFNKRSIYINWKKVKLYNFKLSFPFKYICFTKKSLNYNSNSNLNQIISTNQIKSIV